MRLVWLKAWVYCLIPVAVIAALGAEFVIWYGKQLDRIERIENARAYEARAKGGRG